MSYVVLAVLVGALLGFVASMLPLPPFARCALGGTAAYVVGSAIRLVGWLLHATDESGIAAASASAMYVMVALVAVLVSSGLTPGVLAWLGVPERLHRYAPILVGSLCAVVGALSATPRSSVR